MLAVLHRTQTARIYAPLYGLAEPDALALERVVLKGSARHALAGQPATPPHAALQNAALTADLVEAVSALQRQIAHGQAFAAGQALQRQQSASAAAAALGAFSESSGPYGHAARAMQGAGGPATETAAAAAVPFSCPRRTGQAPGQQTPFSPLGSGSGRNSGASSRSGSPGHQRDPTICRYDRKEGPCYNFLELGYCTNTRGQRLQHPFFAGCDPGKKAALINDYREHCTASGKPFTVHASVATET